MKVVIQRVSSAAVTINGGEKKRIDEGVCVLFGVCEGDNAGLVERLAEKTAKLRIFSDSDDKMNLSAVDLGYSALLIPNFTLCADTKKGLRPSFAAAAKPPLSSGIFDAFCEAMKKQGLKRVETGQFGADMLVDIKNDGPVTIIIDTKEWGNEG